MEYLQYIRVATPTWILSCFKPYYKWNTFNTIKVDEIEDTFPVPFSFKPYYKWNTFNT